MAASAPDQPARLVVTEPVTNAAQHARTMMDLNVRLAHRHLMIEMRDGSSEIPRQTIPAPLPRLGVSPVSGLGLVVIAATADGWGYWLLSAGKLV